MKQITVISGKGGTGKTTLSASFYELTKKCVVADCDVDAPDLHILLKPEIIKTTDFVQGETYIIDNKKCILCRKCYEECRYNAIEYINDNTLNINSYKCENCGLCEYLCPEKAIYTTIEKSGEWYEAKTEYGKMVYASLNPGEENSGKLVAIVRNQSQIIAEKEKQDLIIIDGPPGKGCPVIASITGVDAVVIVTEPTMSGISDSKAVIELAQFFNIKTFVIINKANINSEKSEEIINFCNRNKIHYAGSIDYDKSVIDAVSEGQPVVKLFDNKITEQIKSIWNYIMNVQ